MAAAGTTLTVIDNDGWSDNDWFILGYPGDGQTEACDINQASITRGTSLTVTNSLKFAHGIDTPMTQIYETYIEIWGASSLTGTKTAIAQTTSAILIQWDKPWTEYNVSGTQYAYYFVRFSNGAASPVVGDYSDGVARTGLGVTTAEDIIQNALNLTGESINDLITREFCIRELNNWQDDVTARRNWSWEIVDEQTITSTTNTNKYALSGLSSTLKHTDSDKSIIAVRFGDDILDKMDWLEYLDSQEGVAYTTLSADIAIGATSCTLTDSYEFSETGTIVIGTDTVTYTANTETTGVLSGIPSSGDYSFASTHSSGDAVWQGITPGKPTKFCIYNDNIYTEKPVSSTYAGYKFKVSYYKKISAFSDYADTTDIPFVYLGQYWLAARIEYKKRNFNEANHWLTVYETKLQTEIKKDRKPIKLKIVPTDEFKSIGHRYGHKYESSESAQYNS